ncbi:MAG TPA: hypothetical protein VLW50_32395 [Streptosporangiaceae bacterium]|nr:hypothetical protein [Streptosporangiaceae bacterium]
MHLADAQLATGRDVDLAADLAADGIDDSAHWSAIDRSAFSGGRTVTQPAAIGRILTRRPSRAGWPRYVLFALAGCVLAIAGGGAGAALAAHYDGYTTPVISAAPVSPAADSSSGSQLAKVAAAVLPSVVMITVMTGTQGRGAGGRHRLRRHHPPIATLLTPPQA